MRLFLFSIKHMRYDQSWGKTYFYVKIKYTYSIIACILFYYFGSDCKNIIHKYQYQMCLSVSQAKCQMDLNLMRQNVLFILIKPLTMFCYCIFYFHLKIWQKVFSFLSNPFSLSSLSCLQRIIFVVHLIEMTSYWQPANKQKCEMATT